MCYINIQTKSGKHSVIENIAICQEGLFSLSDITERLEQVDLPDWDKSDVIYVVDSLCERGLAYQIRGKYGIYAH